MKPTALLASLCLCLMFTVAAEAKKHSSNLNVFSEILRECSSRSDCNGQRCVGGYCNRGGDNTGSECSVRGHCGGRQCIDGRCSGNEENTGGECTRRSHCGGYQCVQGQCTGPIDNGDDGDIDDVRDPSIGNECVSDRQCGEDGQCINGSCF